MNKNKRPPGPKGWESVKFLLGVGKNFLEEFDRTRKKHGDVFYYRFQGRDWFVFSSATSAKRILKENYTNYSKEIPRWLLGDIMGEGLILTEGDRWKKQRKTVAPTFHPKNIEKLLPQVFELTKEIFHENSEKQTNISALMNWIAMRVAATCFIGEDLSVKEMEYINRYLPEYSDLAALKLQDPTRNYEWIPTPRNIKSKKIRKALNEISERVAESGKDQARTKTNIVTSILKHAEIEDIQVSDKELQHQIFTFLAAGHETTSNLLNWTLLLVEKHPEVLEKIQAELEGYSEETMSVESLERLVYLNAVIKEAMRLYPPVPSLARITIEDDVIDGYFIPKGSVVPAFQYLIQRNEKYWPDPDSFKPERFLAEDFKESYTPFSYFPFSVGPRSCIGMGFAYMEAKIILAHLYKNYDLKISNLEKIGSTAAVTLRPDPDLAGTVQKKSVTKPVSHSI